MPATVSDEVDLNRVDPKVREFLRSLSIGPQGLNLVLDGQIICKVVPPLRLSEEEKRSLIERRRELMRQARERTKNVPAREMKRKFDAAINEVRRKKA